MAPPNEFRAKNTKKDNILPHLKGHEHKICYWDLDSTCIKWNRMLMRCPFFGFLLPLATFQNWLYILRVIQQAPWKVQPWFWHAMKYMSLSSLSSKVTSPCECLWSSLDGKLLLHNMTSILPQLFLHYHVVNMVPRTLHDIKF